LGRTVLIKMIDDGYAQYSDLLNDPDIDFAKKMILMINSSTQSSQDFNADFLKFMVSEFKVKMAIMSSWMFTIVRNTVFGKNY
jgi:hypothetical protein